MKVPLKHKTKEIYFIFAFIIVLLIGFILGAYFSTEVCKSQTNLKAEIIEKCLGENMIYQDTCGYMDFIENNNQLKECYNKCYTDFVPN